MAFRNQIKLRENQVNRELILFEYFKIWDRFRTASNRYPIRGTTVLQEKDTDSANTVLVLRWYHFSLVSWNRVCFLLFLFNLVKVYLSDRIFYIFYSLDTCPTITRVGPLGIEVLRDYYFWWPNPTTHLLYWIFAN
jgi:hypothetical protein